jgi:hypothetical protein
VNVTLSEGQNVVLFALMVTLTGAPAVRVIVTSSVETGHTPLLTVHRKTLLPAPRDFIFDVGLDGETIVPEPEIKVHVPVPIAGTAAAMNVLSTHTVWSAPALAVEGG